MKGSETKGRRRISRRAVLLGAGGLVVSPFAAAAWGMTPIGWWYGGTRSPSPAWTG